MIEKFFARGDYVMTTRQEAIFYCKAFDNVIEDYPFHDNNWSLMLHIENKKTFACIYEHQNHIWINVKCDPEWREFWRSAFEAIVPAYHMNKEHWNSIILDGTIPMTDIERMISESYELTKQMKIKNKGLN